jgi:magnesium transporter
MQNSDRQEVIEDLLSKVDEGTPEVAQEIEQAHSLDDLALLLESLPVTDRVSFWEQLSPAIQLPVLAEMRADASEAIIRAVDEVRLHDLFAELDADTLLELQDVLTEPLLEEALGRMDTEQKQRYASAQQYADSEVGHWCDHQPLVVPAKTKVNVVLRLLRRVMPKYCDHVFVVDSRGVWVGAVPIHKLFGADGVLKISELVREQFPSLNAREDIYVSADKVASSEEVALPVLDDGGMLIGRLDLGTAYEMQAERAEAQIMATAGLDEDEDLFSPVMKSARNRALWLGINLMTAFLASWFIGLFEATLQQVVALAVLMPVVASMGGIAGSQTLTLIVRGLALGQISKSNLRPLLNKELQVGLLNGVLWAIVIGLIAGYWFNSWGPRLEASMIRRFQDRSF